jgi:hypothetical protein
MKTFVWLQTVAFAIFCMTMWGLAAALAEFVRFHATPVAHLPAFALPIVPHHAWLLFCPLPWVLYAAILSRRRELTLGTVLTFAGTMSIAAAALLGVVALGSIGLYTW